MKKLVFILLPIIFLTGCSIGQKKTFTANTLWVKINPIQCLGNDWEKDWLSQNPGQTYPAFQEEEIIMAYYQSLGIDIFDYRKEKIQEAVCLACNCQTGYTVYLEVFKDDLGKMEGLGFQEK